LRHSVITFDDKDDDGDDSHGVVVVVSAYLVPVRLNRSFISDQYFIGSAKVAFLYECNIYVRMWKLSTHSSTKH